MRKGPTLPAEKYAISFCVYLKTSPLSRCEKEAFCIKK